MSTKSYEYLEQENKQLQWQLQFMLDKYTLQSEENKRLLKRIHSIESAKEFQRLQCHRMDKLGAAVKFLMDHYATQNNPH